MRISENLRLYMNRLIINTANDKLFIVLQTGGNVFCKQSESKMHHNETMLPLIDELLKENKLDIEQIDELGVVVGPGSFTGIRVGIATIKAFRDSLKICAKGINNLDYLYKLAIEKNDNINTVAIKGSRDSYFVARYVNDVVYKYDRNLTEQELKQVSDNSLVGMFSVDPALNCVELEDNANALIACYEESEDYNLIPVYYQLSQAEREKFKRAKIEIQNANISDVNKILEIEQTAIKYNALTLQDIELSVSNKNYKTYKLLFDDELVGFVILQISDEVNIVSIAVKKQFRNLGLATKLLQRAEECAKEEGINTLSLEVSYNNVGAFLLYEKFGFKLRRIRKNYYQDNSDCLEMIKQI